MTKRHLSFQRALWGIAGIFLTGTVVILLFLHVINQYSGFKGRAAKMRTAFETRQKQLIRREVDRIIEQIEYKRSRIIPKAGALVKAAVHEAESMIHNARQKADGSIPAWQIRETVINTLGPMSVCSGKGRLFILNLKGQIILGEENRDLRYADLIQLAKQEGEGLFRAC